MSDRTFFEDYFFFVTSTTSFQGHFLYSIINTNPREAFILDLVDIVNSIYFPFWLIISFFVILKLTVFSLDLIFSEIFPFFVKIKEILCCQRRFGNTQLFSPVFSRLKKPYQYMFYSFGSKPIDLTLSIAYIMAMLTCNAVNLFGWTINNEEEYNRFLADQFQVLSIMSCSLFEQFLLLVTFTVCLCSSIRKAFFLGLALFLGLNCFFVLISYINLSVSNLKIVALIYNTLYFIVMLGASMNIVRIVYRFDVYAFNLRSFMEGRKIKRVSTCDADIKGLKLENYISPRENSTVVHKFNYRKLILVTWSVLMATNIVAVAKSFILLGEALGIELYLGVFDNWFYVSVR